MLATRDTEIRVWFEPIVVPPEYVPRAPFAAALLAAKKHVAEGDKAEEKDAKEQEKHVALSAGTRRRCWVIKEDAYNTA